VLFGLDGGEAEAAVSEVVVIARAVAKATVTEVAVARLQ
jgi:hypothetical protein